MITTRKEADIFSLQELSALMETFRLSFSSETYYDDVNGEWSSRIILYRACRKLGVFEFKVFSTDIEKLADDLKTRN